MSRLTRISQAVRAASANRRQAAERIAAHAKGGAKRGAKPAQRRVALEAIEPRMLLSADPMLTGDAGKLGYAPGETVHLTASNFSVGETVDLQVSRNGSALINWAVTDGGDGDLDGVADGAVSTSWETPLDSEGTTFKALAQGETSGLSATTNLQGLVTWVHALPTDYAPGETANIFAGGFQIGEAVEFQIANLTNGYDYTPPWQVVDGSADDLDGVADGRIQTGWLVPPDAANTTLRVDAKGISSGLAAINTFTDAVTVTAAIGGTNLSPALAANGASPGYTTLGNIVISENNNNDFDKQQSDVTLVLSAPTGWSFNPGVGSLSLSTSGQNSDISIAANGFTVDASTITIKFSTNNNSNAKETLTITGIQVRANTTASLAGNILRTTSNPGTAALIVGITNGSTSFGALSLAANTAPTVANRSAPESYTEDVALNLTDIVVTDPDSNVTATLTLSNNAAGSLSTATSGSVTSTYSPTTGVWTASGSVASVNALLAGLTFTPAANFNSSFTIATNVSDGVAAAITGTKVFTGIAVNDAPTASPDTATLAEDGSVVINVLGNDSKGPANESGQTLAVTSATALHGAVVINADGTLKYTPDADYNGADTISYSIVDNGTTNNIADPKTASSTVAVTITPVNDAPTVAFVNWTGDGSLQYSDGPTTAGTPWKIVVTDIDSPLSSLVLSNLPAGITTSISDSGNTRTYTLGGLATAAPNGYSLKVTDGVAPLQDAGKITVTQEDARVTYTGLQYVTTSSATSSTATVVLSATIQDITATSDAAGDVTAGDIRKATVTFINRDTNAVIATNVPVALVSAADTKTGTASFNWNVDIGNQISQTYTVGVIVNNYYTRNSSADNTLIQVAKPVAGSINGGGYLVNTAANPSTGTYAGAVDAKTNFGLNVKFNKQGTNLQGNVNIIIRSNDGHVYQVKSNAIDSLNLASPQTGWTSATFTSKANVTDITNPLAPVVLGGNKLLQITMIDKGEPGSSDTIGITLTDSTGVLFSSSWNGTKTVERILNGGNLQVRQALMLDGTAVASSGASSLTQEQLQPIVEAAKASWRATGLSAEQLKALEALQVTIDDLSDTELGWQNASTLAIDANAAGHGWFVDSTPLDSREFVAGIAVDAAAIGKVDLLSVVEHEIGHALGFDHEEGAGVMSDALGVGVRRIEEAASNGKPAHRNVMPAVDLTVPAQRAAVGAGMVERESGHSLFSRASEASASPRIDWDVLPGRSVANAVAKTVDGANKRWVKDFVTGLGNESRSVNAGLRVNLAVTPALQGKLSKIA